MAPSMKSSARTAGAAGLHYLPVTPSSPRERTTVTRSADKEALGLGALDLALARDESLKVRVGEAESGGGSPVAEEARLDVVDRELLAHDAVALEEDLSGSEVAACSPVGDDRGELEWGSQLVDSSDERPSSLTCSTVAESTWARSIWTAREEIGRVGVKESSLGSTGGAGAGSTSGEDEENMAARRGVSSSLLHCSLPNCDTHLKSRWCCRRKRSCPSDSS